MANFTLELLALAGEHDGIPYGPTAYIALSPPYPDIIKDLPVKAGEEKRDFYVITPDCASFQDLDSEVNRLIKELEYIRRQGKTFFEKDAP